MESVGSNSQLTAAPSPHPHIADRIARAFRHRLRLLHRAGPTFHVLGATANVYAVTLSAAPTCSCPDRATPCKHILFVILRVLRLPLAHPALRRRSLRPCLLSRLLSSPTAPDSLAGPRARERFRQILRAGGDAAGEGKKVGACPVCLEEMEGEEVVVVTCGTCGNSLHGECLERWKRCCRGRRAATCVMCRTRWTERRNREGYVNLAEYVCEEDGVDGGGSEWSSCGGAAAPPG